MKKIRLIIAAFVVAVAIVINFNVTFESEKGRTSISLENVEALAHPEGTLPGWGMCYGTGSLTCPMDYSKVKTYSF